MPWLYNIRIFLALSGTAALPWLLGDAKLTIPLTLGVVAAALADLDDRLTGRLRNLIITLISFFDRLGIGRASVSLALGYLPLGLSRRPLGLFCWEGWGNATPPLRSAHCLSPSTPCLVPTLYTAWYQQPLLLLAGAIWFNVLTLVGHLVFPIRPLQDNLARCYEQLSQYLELKARLFDPDIEEESQAPLYELALANGQLVSTLNQTKASLLTRLRGDRGQRGTRRTLHYYFAAQDIHERASSSHIQYQTLREHFRYSDVMFRFQRLITLQSQACSRLANAILLRTPYQHDHRFERAFIHLDAALDRIRASGTTSSDQLKALGFLLDNLRAIDAQLASIESGQPQTAQKNETENLLADDSLHGLSDIWLRLRNNLTPESALFRHAVRMSVVLCAGLRHHPNYRSCTTDTWILLTSLLSASLTTTLRATVSRCVSLELLQVSPSASPSFILSPPWRGN